jgi:hypothetical protein
MPVSAALGFAAGLWLAAASLATAQVAGPAASSSWGTAATTSSETDLRLPPLQESAPPPPAHTGIRAVFVSLIQDFRHLPSRETLGWSLFGGALALSAHPLDGTVNRHLVGKTAVHHFFLPGKIIGTGYVQVAGSIGTYAVGRLSRRPRVSHVGMDLLRAQMLVGAVTYGLKYTVRRERPNGLNHRSFPSGHAAVTFASATVLQRHLGWRWSMPLFFIASYTAASRLHENVHYLSDVVAGATCGVIAGRTVTRHGRTVWALAPVWSKGEVALFLNRRF